MDQQGGKRPEVLLFLLFREQVLAPDRRLYLFNHTLCGLYELTRCLQGIREPLEDGEPPYGALEQEEEEVCRATQQPNGYKESQIRGQAGAFLSINTAVPQESELGRAHK